MSIINSLFKENEYVSGLTSEAKAIYVYNIFKNSKDSVVLLSNSLYESNLFYQSLLNYTEDVLFFPMDDFLTSEALAISPEFEITRLETINEIIKGDKKIIITNLMGFLRYLPTKDEYIKKIIKLNIGQDCNIRDLVSNLISMGYKRETTVSKTGDLAVRGFVVDIFPLGESNPSRIEFWGDNIESIRVFDENTQLTIKKENSINIKPCTEFLIDQELDSFKHRDMPKYTKVSSIVDYISNAKVIYNDYNQIITGYELLLEEISNYNDAQGLDNKTTYMNNLDDIHIKSQSYILNFDNKTNNVKNTLNFNTYEIEPFSNNIDIINKALDKYIKEFKTVIICLPDKYKINKIIDNIENSNIVITNENEIIDNKINLIIRNMSSGFIYDKYVFLTENELFNKKNVNLKYKSNFKFGSKVRDISKLTEGDYIVHNLYGIGKYLGLKTLVKNGLKKDYLSVEYKDSDKLYIPVEKIDLISKYSSNEGMVPKISKLGGTDWEKTKLRVRKKIEDIALELLELYARRESSVGYSFVIDDENQLEFEKEFPYNETIDQIKVSDEIKKDMISVKPMDRLICGDVGFGKTEMAFRAMFKAVMSGKQVAYLCPTTILSNQQYNSAIDRFKSFAVRIVILNRFVTPKKVMDVKRGLKEGKVDIVIGTHRLLSEDIEFKDLGLLVIDEEQRFGVKHKEKIKTFKNNIDILTLSATPIPRTLQMSMVGIRNLSLLETAPTNRYPVQTYVLEENNGIIKDAIYKELARDGQVFILYNYVRNMEEKARELSRLVPDARIVYANGQMNKSELEEVMLKFINKEADVLLCTTIIETGIDIASANTLIIIDADRFGLSQLYQIRGRVGRSNKIAYCYLMYDKYKTLSDIANKRLSVIKEFTELGSGFSIAMRDLSIRGAGDILGSEQAGFIDTVGIELYLKMLNEEVNKLKGIYSEEETIDDTKPLIEIETTIDDNYVEEVDLKIEIHKKIGEIDSFDKLNEIKKELEDRFGNVSENMMIYMYEEWFEKLAHKYKINRIRQTRNFIEIILPDYLNNQIDGKYLFFEVSKLSRIFRFSKRGNNLVVTMDIVRIDKHFIYYLIDFMGILEKSITKKDL